MTFKMPEPEFRLRWHSIRAAYTVSKPDVGDTDVFTADQVRAAYEQGLEAAARLIEKEWESYLKYDPVGKVGRQDPPSGPELAASIRNLKGPR